MPRFHPGYRSGPGSSLPILLLAAGLMLAVGATGAERPGEVAASTVVVVKNLNNPDSVAVADYYARKRKLPTENVCAVRVTDVEECSYKEVAEQLMGPLKQFLARLKRPIDYIVLTKGIPIRIHEGYDGGLSVDSLVVTMDKPEFPGFPGGVEPGTRLNPYFVVAERFSHARFGIYLVTRLTGYARADCLRLVDNSLAARRSDGPFLLHTGPGHTDEGYKSINDGMRRADEILRSRHLASILSTGEQFPGDRNDLMGYYSWGSNDLKFDKRAYNSLAFAPGGIAETAVSTSGRTFAAPQATGQSLIADLIAQGVTGCKGYVSEPGAPAFARAEILFDRYTAGFNLAESFYSASWQSHNKDMVIGDPLCAPYSSEAKPAGGWSMGTELRGPRGIRPRWVLHDLSGVEGAKG
jgi:uncharacterized protein (TIGR03790 family)